jgi:hypothetical protein
MGGGVSEQGCVFGGPDRPWPRAKKRRPPEGGLSLGRKRPKEGMCDVSHRSNIALHRNKCKQFFVWHASHAQTNGLETEQLLRGSPKKRAEQKNGPSKKGGRP